jgi:hypothetical protein
MRAAKCYTYGLAVVRRRTDARMELAHVERAILAILNGSIGRSGGVEA